jgi:hypothetical protein
VGKNLQNKRAKGIVFFYEQNTIRLVERDWRYGMKEDEESIYARVNDLFNEYYKNRGVRPTRIYVGHVEWREMACTPIADYRFSGNPETVFMGLDVFEVSSENHLFVC